ncbi:SigE family RNA polymerase sigma factor [Dactylosporangium vinaceum]|uniref:SigE family RNA polymerase sigma factor n=2 Tax=Dactylosporangium vinaceum TaxID=53362 RepID=A0ABV5MKZ5_9ACTN|nr:SigE family RNA polymerase sigma factor [Dactylosporangium vinaceum]
MSGPADFDDFYAGTYRRVVGQLYAMVGNLSEVEDAVQEAYTRAWQRWGRLRAYADPEAWVRTVAYRVAVSSWRKAVNRVTAHRRHGPPADAPELDPGLLNLAAALRKVPPDQRRLLVLHYVVGLSVEAIAQETGTPTGTVKSRLSRGRAALRAELQEEAEHDV